MRKGKITHYFVYYVYIKEDGKRVDANSTINVSDIKKEDLVDDTTKIIKDALREEGIKIKSFLILNISKI